MRNNNNTNNLIKWMVIGIDFLILNVLVVLFLQYYPDVSNWGRTRIQVFWLMSNLGMVMSQYRFSTIIHQRMVTSTDMLQRVIMLVMTQTALTYLMLRLIDIKRPVGWKLIAIGVSLMVVLIVARIVERKIVKRYRMVGRNTRMATLVGSDKELQNVYERMVSDPTTGYKVLGYYADEKPEGSLEGLTRMGSLQELLKRMDEGREVEVGDELYVCLSRRDHETVKRLSMYCDQHVVRFFYVPMSVESLGISLKREMMDDIEVYTTYENPLQNPVNRLIKRAFDVTFSALLLLCMLPFFPIVALIIKWQSPGPIFFKQLRTGLDGKEFWMYKFRSMHVNKDADRVQATADDPRKYAFGNFMRKANIDELPQFWNVLMGDMSIVGPRPHMLAHTEMYSQLIGKYMVRHFVKPGVTGWAQVTGFRGETRELWQMEERVKRDIWYMENWNFWLDLRIIWMTAKTVFVHDKNAY